MKLTTFASTVHATSQYVRPLLSTNPSESRRRVLGLYKAWYRYIPYLLHTFSIPKNEQQCKCKLREYFYKNACVTDIRLIDMMVFKGYIELEEMMNVWQQKNHVMAHFRPTADPKPATFIGKFIAGVE